MLVGPVMFYDLVRTARRSRYFISRCAYLGVLTLVLCWMYFIWMMRYRNQAVPPAEMATFAEWFFYVYLAVQFIVLVLVTPAYTAGAIAEEKEHRTIEYLLATDLRNREIVLGKFSARVCNLLLLIISALPILGFIQLMGGMDPDLLLGSFAGTTLTLVELASLSILFSVYTKRSRDAILLTYFAALVYWGVSAASLTLLTYPQISDFALLPGKPPYTVEDLLWHFNVGNPFVMCVRLYRDLFAGVSLAGLLTQYLLQYGGFALTVSLVCCTWAVLRVRAVSLRQTQGGTPRVRRYPHRWGRPPVGNDPMLWKEIFEPGLRFSWLGRVISLLIAVFLMAPLGAILIDSTRTGGPGFWGYSEGLAGFLCALVAAACTFMLLGVSVRAAGSLSGERDILTLDSLLTTPLTSNAILFAKWLGAIAGMRWAWFLLLAAWGLGVYSEKLHWFVFPLLFFTWFVYAAFAAQVGVWYSLISPTTLRATLRTLMTLVGLGIGHWLLWLYYLPLFLHLDERDLDPALLKDIHLGLTPPAVFTMLTFESQWSEARLMSRDFWQPAAFVLAGLGGTVLATYVLFLTTRSRFRVLCARTPNLKPEREPEAEGTSPAPVSRFFPRLAPSRAGIIVALILAPILLLVGVYYYAITLSDRRLAETFAELEKTDPRWKFWEIEADRKQYPDEENGALHAINARAKMPRVWPPVPKTAGGAATGGFGPAGDKFLDDYVAVPPEQQLDSWQTKELREALDKVTAAREEARALVKYQGGRIPVQWAPDIFSTLLPDLQEMRLLANLLQFDAKLRAQDGDADGALLSARAILHVGRAIGDEQIMISQLVRIAVRTVGLKTMQRVLAQGEPSEKELKTFQELLEDELQEPLWIICLRGERAAFHSIMEQAREGTLNAAALGAGRGTPGENFFLSLTSRNSELFGLKYYQRVFEIAALPAHEQFRELELLDKDLRKAKAAHGLRAPLAFLLLPATQKVLQAVQQSQANLRCGIMVLAAERFRRQHGRWPESLDALVPQFATEVPIDPYNGKSLRMKRLDDGLVIYTVGSDGIDNGGKLDDSTKAGTDLGYRLWDVPKRRQPPRNPEMGPPAPPPEKQ